VKLRFEQIFVKHYERLTGSKQTVGGLPLTMENIICMILFGGRELDIEDIYGDVSERYSMETFMSDAREAGLETDERLRKAVSELIAQKFLHLQPDGHYYSYQATRETARMINKVYPKMQGMSMLAYIGQTIEEVGSGRVDLETALSRFEQTLQKQGIALSKPKIPVIAPPKPVAPSQKIEETKPWNSKIIRDYVVSNPVKTRIEKTKATAVASPEPAVVMAPEEDVFVPEMTRPAEIPEASAFAAGREPGPQTEKAPAEPPLAESGEEAVLEEEIADDEAIAAKIAAFEKELALVCPICKVSVLKEEKTAAGKLFYSCTSAKCNFISWGRPHQIPCPRCKNPFMVEVTDSEGHLILKCPRATCHHRQALTSTPPAGGVKKVVRKRLVRRKV